MRVGAEVGGGGSIAFDRPRPCQRSSEQVIRHEVCPDAHHLDPRKSMVKDTSLHVPQKDAYPTEIVVGNFPQVVNDAEPALRCLVSLGRGKDGLTWVCAGFKSKFPVCSTVIGG